MKEHPSVVMEKMLVDIDVSPAVAKVHCRFTLHNIGPAVRVPTGFPEEGNSEARDHNRQPPGFLTFTTSVDGRVLPTRIAGYKVAENGWWTRWRVATVPFAAGQRRIVEIRYTAPVGNDYQEIETGIFDFLVHTGASWKGTIGYGRVRFHLHYNPNYGKLEAGYRRYQEMGARRNFRKLGPRRVEWVRRNFEPTEEDDLEVLFTPITRMVVVGGDTVGERFRVDRYAANGILMVPLWHTREWLGAEADIQPNKVTLVRGARTVTLLPGEFRLEREDESFAPPIRAMDEKILIPLAAVARALGAQVAYELPGRIVRITLPASSEAELRRLLRRPKPGPKGPRKTA